MACRVRFFHSLVLGLIGMSLLTYSSFFGSPASLFSYARDSGKLLKTVDSFQTAFGNGTSAVSLHNSSHHLARSPLSSTSTSRNIVLQLADKIQSLNNTLNNSHSAVLSETPTSVNNSMIIDSSNSEQKIQNTTTDHTSMSVSSKILQKPSQLSSTSESTIVSNTSTLDSADKSFLTHDIYESGYYSANIELCPDLGNKLKILIIVTSAPSHRDARMAIRQTWGHFSQRNDVAIAFFLGSMVDKELCKSVESEANMYGDIISARFLDSYNNLTLKTVSLLEWVDTYCNQVKYVLKTDDDMFINVPALLNFVEKHTKDKRTIFGRLAKRWKPIRNKKSKYYVSPQQFSLPVFPDFTTGPAYLMTNDVVSDLYKKALQRTYLKLEDVFLTGIVAQELKIKRTHVNEFLNKRISFNPCNIQRGISIHMVKYHEQFDLWKKLLDRRSKCK